MAAYHVDFQLMMFFHCLHLFRDPFYLTMLFVFHYSFLSFLNCLFFLFCSFLCFVLFLELMHQSTIKYILKADI